MPENCNTNSPLTSSKTSSTSNDKGHNTRSVNDGLARGQRALTCIESIIIRAIRGFYHHENQYPPELTEMLNLIEGVRLWIQEKAIYADTNIFQILTATVLQQLSTEILNILRSLKPVAGKRLKKQDVIKNEEQQTIQLIQEQIKNMIDAIAEYEVVTTVSDAFEQAISKGFIAHFSKISKKNKNSGVSQRGSKTYIFPCFDPSKYGELIQDSMKFRREVVDKLVPRMTGHKGGCSGNHGYNLSGMRSNPRKPIMVGGKQEEFLIRLIVCRGCKSRISLLPSFLPREKHFHIALIGQVLDNLTRYAVCIQGAINNLCTASKKVCKQTIFNWIRWAGTNHPATILVRSNVSSKGYLQQDEGFEREANLRTYTVAVVDSFTQVVWHLDYVDHVSEKVLQDSFSDFLKKISFDPLGFTKDKWKASTNAIKAVFRGVWIGYCHRHFLKKLNEDLNEYQKQTGKPAKIVRKIYRDIKKMIGESNSGSQLKAKLNTLDSEIYKHPLLAKRINQLKDDASYYTVTNRRKGITKTTSIVDNFLKVVKRKLKQVESFRHQEYTSLLFRAMANVRNFFKFGPGAKNAHKSPFELAGGQTYSLSWIETMNVHDAFIF